ncbi:Zinc finger, PHD-finger [Dillenia turbinata]|uniref:Zinc finger, PHD-finger n=1 Tax=Dillenia turbinata TaxID=194707 RepID=A0AAN8UDL8_9MAGN
MSNPILEVCGKRKRRSKFFSFHNFADPSSPFNTNGPFRDNIRFFLKECTEIEDYLIEGNPTWCTLLIHENNGVIVPLFTIEEIVKNSSRPLCDHCRCSGWSHHFVSKRKYHLIIPVDDEWNEPLDDGAFDVQTHLLHGLVHCNGFGHLLCINGIEGGSKNLSGREIMDLWDRICTSLRARKITVEDVAKKRSMDLRLLHGVAYGHTWFGRWGYKFCHGSFGVMEHNYDRAIEILSSLNIDEIISDFGSTNKSKEIKQIVQYYRELSETQLVTMRDLLRFMLTLKSRAPVPLKRKMITQNSDSSFSWYSFPTSSKLPSIIRVQRKPLGKEKAVKYRKFSTLVLNMDSRWPARRLEYAAEVIVDALKEKKESELGSGGMTRQQVRDAARLLIGDTGLLDFVLKSLNNVIVGKYIVCRAVNPATRVLEYTICDVGKASKDTEPEFKIISNEYTVRARATGSEVYDDVTFVYTNIFMTYPNSDLIRLATLTVLDTKYFVKEWPFKDENDQLLRFICKVMPKLTESDSELTRRWFPSEIVAVPLHATVAELKGAIQAALRDTYCVTERFVVREIENMEDLEDREVLFGSLESGSEVWVQGDGMDMETELRYEGGNDTWTVRCQCGARDDDGERMIACDICEVWHHTRCCGIKDSDATPPIFVCSGCSISIMPPRVDLCTELPLRVELSPESEYLNSLILPQEPDFGTELLC